MHVLAPVGVPSSGASSTFSLSCDDLAAAPAAVGGDDELGLAVVDAVRDRLGAEAAEDHRVHRADARAGEHGDGGLGDHRHVDRDAVALLDAEVLEDVGEAADLAMELLVGERALTSPGSPSKMIAALFSRGGAEVPVEAVLRDVELAADEPLGVRAASTRGPS